MALSLPPLPPPPGARSRSWVSPVHRWLGFGQAAPGREARGGKESRGPLRGAGEGRASTHTRAPASTGHSDAPARDTPPPQKRPGSAQSRSTARGRGARAFTLTPATLRLPDRAEPREQPASPRRRRRQRSSNKSSERLPGRRSHGSRSSAGPGSVRSTRGGGGGMWPLPPIHKSSAGHRWRAGLSGARRSGGRALRRARRRQENKRARRRELRSCVRGLVAAGSGARLGAARRGPRWGRGASDGASCSAPSPGLGGRRRSRERGSGHRRRSLPGGGSAAKDTCRLPGLRRARASA